MVVDSLFVLVNWFDVTDRRHRTMGDPIVMEMFRASKDEAGVFVWEGVSFFGVTSWAIVMYWIEALCRDFGHLFAVR